MPWYTVAEAARYLSIPTATLRSWTAGRRYPVSDGSRRFEPLLQRPDPSDPRLSFSNLVEAHVLRSLREEHLVRMGNVRTALEFAAEQLGIDRLLFSRDLQTSAGDLFIERYGQLINLSRHGQMALKELLHAHLERVKRDRAGMPVRLYPVTRWRIADSPTHIAIDPKISFGRPVTSHHSIRTAVISKRFLAGESVMGIARDYELKPTEIEEAIRYERAA